MEDKRGLDLQHLVTRHRFDSELDDEIRFHIDSRVEDLVSQGQSPSAARAEARREFGGIARFH